MFSYLPLNLWDFPRVRYPGQHPPVAGLEEDCSISMSWEGCQLLISGGTKPELAKLGPSAGENISVSHWGRGAPVTSSIFYQIFSVCCSNLNPFQLNVRRRRRKVQEGHYFSISALAGPDLWTIDHEDVTGGVGSISHGVELLPSSAQQFWNVNMRPGATGPTWPAE